MANHGEQTKRRLGAGNFTRFVIFTCFDNITDFQVASAGAQSLRGRRVKAERTTQASPPAADQDVLTAATSLKTAKPSVATSSNGCFTKSRARHGFIAVAGENGLGSIAASWRQALWQRFPFLEFSRLPWQRPYLFRSRYRPGTVRNRNHLSSRVVRWEYTQRLRARDRG